MKIIIKNHLSLVFSILWTAFFTLYEIWAMCVATIIPFLILHISAFLFQIICFCFFTTKFVGIIKKEMNHLNDNGGNIYKTFD